MFMLYPPFDRHQSIYYHPQEDFHFISGDSLGCIISLCHISSENRSSGGLSSLLGRCVLTSQLSEFLQYLQRNDLQCFNTKFNADFRCIDYSQRPIT